MLLSISIVNHNNRELLDVCLTSVHESTRGLDFEAIVIDNASEDGSAEMVREKHPNVLLIVNERRLGFAANQNQGLRRAAGEFVALLNNDTVVRPGAFDKLVSFMRENPRAGLAGPRLLNPDGSLQESCYRTPTLGVLFHDAFFISSLFPRSAAVGGFKSWGHDEAREAPSLSGACIFARAAAVAEVGLLDERFFMYFEDHDWCLRFRRAGWKVYFVPDAEVVHFGGGSEGMLGHDRFAEFYKGMNLFYGKHYGRASLPAVAFLNVIGSALRIAAWAALAPFSARFREKLRTRAPYFMRRIAWYLSPKGN
jgi:hypothetical protein